MILKVLTHEQQIRSVKTCQENLDTCESDPEFFNNFITDDESRVFEYEPVRQKINYQCGTQKCQDEQIQNQIDVHCVFLISEDCSITSLYHVVITSLTSVQSERGFPNIFLFLRLKEPMESMYFETIEGIKTAYTATLKDIP